jgi:hypothetical protein
MKPWEKYAAQQEDNSPSGGATAADAAMLPFPAPITSRPTVDDIKLLQNQLLAKSGADVKPWDRYAAAPQTSPSLLGKAARFVADAVIPGVSSIPPNVQDAMISREGIQKAAQVVTTPIRGMRGLGVGAERLISGDAPSQALDRSAAAVKPGYIPQPGEKLGAFAGEMAATAPIFEAAGGGSLLSQVAKGAMSAGTLRTIQDAAERGDVHIPDVVFSSVLGGVIPLVIPTAQTVFRALRATNRVAGAMGTTLTTDATEALAKDPTLLSKYQGTAEAIGEKVQKVQKALISQHEKVVQFLERVRNNIGFREPFMSQADRIAKEGLTPKPVQDIVEEFQVLKNGKVPVEAMRKAQKITSEDRSVMGILIKKTEVNRPGKITKTEMQIPDKLRLRELYRLRESIDDYLTFPQGGGDVPRIGRGDQNFLQTMRAKVNSIIEEIPGGKTLRMADEAYSLSRKLYDDLQKKLATQGKAEQVIQQILKGGDINEVIGLKGDNLRLLQSLERKTGQKFLEPLKKELAAKSFREMKATGISGVVHDAVGGENVSKALNILNSFANKGESVAKSSAPLSPFMQAIAASQRRRY